MRISDWSSDVCSSDLLVMIEAMACGTPVIAYNRGSVPEVVEHGVTGFIVEDEVSAAGAVRDLANLSREAIRARFEDRFTSRRMAAQYVDVYQIGRAHV